MRRSKVADNMERLLRGLEVSRESAFGSIMKEPHRAAKVFAWPVSYCLEAALIAFKQSGNVAFLEFVASTFRTVLSWRDCEVGLIDTYRGRSTNTWSDGAYAGGGVFVSHVSVGGRITFPALEFCRIVFSEGLNAYIETAKIFLDACIDAVDEYEEDFIFLDGNSRYYLMPGKNEVEAFNHVHSLVNSQIVLYELTGEERFRERALDALGVWRRGIEVGQTWKWRYRPKWLSPSGRAAPEPMWKAAVTVQTARIAHRAKLLFRHSDMEALAETFMHSMSDEQGNIYERMDTRRKYLVTKDHPLGSRIHGVTAFLHFAQFKPEIVDRIRLIVNLQPELFPKGWFSSPSALRGAAFGVDPASVVM